MRLITCHQGTLQDVLAPELSGKARESFITGQAAIDRLVPGGAFARGAVHELLAEPAGPLPIFIATLLARSCLTQIQPLSASAPSGIIIWSDPDAQLYPPALVRAGIPLERLILLRPRNDLDLVWSAAESLACRGVAATIASPRFLSRLEARRLQLAAERGRGVGILLRTLGPSSTHYAAATRWRVRPIPGDRIVQRWELQLIHGHGGLIGHSVIVENSRETNSVRAFAPMAHRSLQKALA